MYINESVDEWCIKVVHFMISHAISVKAGDLCEKNVVSAAGSTLYQYRTGRYQCNFLCPQYFAK